MPIPLKAGSGEYRVFCSILLVKSLQNTLFYFVEYFLVYYSQVLYAKSYHELVINTLIFCFFFSWNDTIKTSEHTCLFL